MAHLSLALLGAPRIARDGTPVQVDTNKAIALLAYLAVTAESPTRDALAALFWPESDRPHARAALRQTLSALRKAVGEGWLKGSRESVYLERGPRFWLDVAQFHSLLAECRRHGHGAADVCPSCLGPLRRAVALYRGDFLSGFSLRDSPAFDEWQRRQAEDLRREWTQALERLVRYYRTHGEWEPAIALARRWLEGDPLHEPAHRQLMQLYAWAGQRAAALRQYDDCCLLLARELNVPPEEETTRLYQAIRADRLPPPATSRAALPLHVHRLHLPAQAVPFVGREEELAQIGRLLADPACRLLTLVGPGGVGKTRLALQAATERAASFTHGACLVPLTGLASADLLVPTIAAALSFPLSSGPDPQEQLLSYLRGKDLLLVLDCFEHLLAGTGLLVEILERAPQVKLLVTSRERLDLRWEWLLDVRGLAFPARAEPDHAERYSAVQLFQQIAQRVRAEFTLGPESTPAVIRTCQLVDGLPLAIELAAAWVRTLSCEQIAQTVARNIDLLATSQRDVPARHRSVPAVFDHSWSLLTPEEAQVLRQLAVFRGGLQAAAAAQVAGATPPVLAALVDKSLLRAAGAGRYELHELLRQYAGRKLAEVPQERAAARRRHGCYYAGFLHERAPGLKGERQKEALAEIGQEVDNVRAAWAWMVEHGAGQEIADSAESLYMFYEMQVHFAEGAEAFAQAGAALQQSGPARGAAGRRRDLVLGDLLARQGWFTLRLAQRDQTRPLFERSIALLRRAAARPELAFALNNLGMLLFLTGECTEAEQLCQEALAIGRETGERRQLARSLTILGLVAAQRGAYLAARPLFEEGLAICRASGDLVGTTALLNNLGGTAHALGEYGEARKLYQESLDLETKLCLRKQSTASILLNLGDMTQACGDYAAARELLQECIALAQELGTSTALAVVYLGNVALLLGEYEEAGRLLHEGLALLREEGDSWGLTCALGSLGDLAGAQGEYSSARGYFREALQLATEIQAVPRALDLLAGVAGLLAREGDGEWAAEIAVLAQSHPGAEQGIKDRVQKLLPQLQSLLAPHTLAAARERGQARRLEAAVAVLLEKL